MKGFALTDTGDLLIENNQISLVFEEGLLQQKVKTVLGTNLKEWPLDWEEGIDFRNILGKGINSDLIRDEIEKGLAQVDSSFVITDFEVEHDKETRKTKVTFSAQTASGEEVGGEYTWG